PGADAAAEPGQFGAASRQPGQQVAQLRQFHLQLALAGPCPLGEDIQDQLGAVQHTGVEGLLQVAGLGGAEVVVENDQVSAGFGHLPRQFLQLAAADEIRRVRAAAPLGDDAYRLGPGGADQFLQFQAAVLQRPVARPLEVDDHQKRPLDEPITPSAVIHTSLQLYSGGCAGGPSSRRAASTSAAVMAINSSRPGW